jgi:hypothetical protein
MKKLLIGGQALAKLGSRRHSVDTDYLINDTTTKDMFIHDNANNIDYCNANGLKFFKEVWDMEESRGTVSEMASPQALLELKAFSFVQNCLNGHFQKADDAEYDIKFLIRNRGVKTPKIAFKYVHGGGLIELQKVIDSVRK